jgi:transcription factor C subunit 3
MRTAIYRLEETGMVQRKRALKRGSNTETSIVIKLLRPPQQEDLNNLSFRRKAVPAEPSEEILEEDEDGDELMRDLDLELEFDVDEEENDRIPPQWEPGRLVSNMMFDAIDLGGINGVDAARVRDRTMGKFWKRPSESFISRLTDNWELSQRPHQRHRAIIRDTTVTDEKRRVHYVYRTHENFQKAVDDGQVSWEPVSREAQKKASANKDGEGSHHKNSNEPTLNQWGFCDISVNKFHSRVGSSSLSECRVSVVRRRPQLKAPSGNPSSVPISEFRRPGRPKNPGKQKAEVKKQAPKTKSAKTLPPAVNPLLSQAQRIALGLPPRGRLGIFIEEQIRDHRKKTGDPNSIPEVLHKDDKATAKLRQIQRTKMNRKDKVKMKDNKPTIFTVEFRKAHGLPLKGKLPQDTIDHYRSKYGDEWSAPTLQEGFPDDQNDVEVQSSSNLSLARHISDDMGISYHENSIPSVEATIVRRDSTERQSLFPAGTKRKPPPLEESQQTPKRIREYDRAQSALSTPDATPSAAHVPATPLGASPITIVETPVPPTRDSTVPITAPSQTELTLSGRKPLNARMQAVLKRFKQRSQPGLYLNPFATRPIPRGRPKKAFLAVFKSDGLKEFVWFTSTSNQVSGALVNKPPEPPEQDTSLTERRICTSQLKSTQEPSMIVQVPASPSNLQQITIANGDSNRGALIFDEMLLHNADPEQSNAGASQEAVRTETDRNSFSYLTPAIADTEELIVASDELPYSLSGRIQSSWSETDGSKRPQMEAYHSHYRTTLQASSPAPAATDMEVSDSNSVVSKTPTPAVEFVTSETARLSDTERDISDSVDATPPSERQAHGTFHKRGVVLGRGNMFSLRNQIMLEILDLCGGVFPSHGEMMAPFFGLWEQRAPKNFRKPDRSTVASTLRNLVDKPSNNIRMITFSMPTLDGKGTVERSLIAYNHISPSDERVRAVQHGMTTAHPRKFWPEPIRHLIPPEYGEEPQYRPPEPELDTSIHLDNFVPPASKKIDDRVKLAMRKRRKEELQKKRNDEANRAVRNVEVESALLTQLNTAQTSGRTRRARLETLNVGGQPRRGFSAFLHSRTPNNTGWESDSSDDIPLAHIRSSHLNASSPVRSTSSEDTLLLPPITKLNGNASFAMHENQSISSESDSFSDEAEAEVDTGSDSRSVLPIEHGFVNLSANDFEQDSHGTSDVLMDPQVLFYPKIGTFSTEFFSRANPRPPGITASFDGPPNHATNTYRFITEQYPEKGKKRVRFANDEAGPKNKRRRLSSSKEQENQVEVESIDLAGEGAVARPKKYPFKGRGKFQQVEPPTVVERLTGLTGDSNDPIYVPPKKKRNRSIKPWTPARPSRERKDPPPRKVAESIEPADIFKKKFYTLVIASCMSGEEGIVDWSVVTNVYRSERGFQLDRFKKLWLWIQENMSSQLQSLTDSFQSTYLEAYENGRVEGIEDPATHNWTGLVRWALQACAYPETSLKLSGNVKPDLVIDELPQKAFDRPHWIEQKMSHVTRAQRVLKYSYGVPLCTGPATSTIDETLRARSWIRSNIATPQHLYISTQAEQKLLPLGETLLGRVVYDLVDRRIIRQRKLKRLLPGRNYNFTAVFATNFRRTFELDTFIDAVELKKSLDVAFANEDSEKRVFTISRTAKDGAVMAILTLLNEGRVRILPKLPPVNNTLKAPYPRLSVWGFSEGEYVHRSINRKSMFWNVEVVPTSSYEFGNPLQPSPSAEIVQAAGWRKAPTPPLPGKNASKALLPIWSSIDGRHITWPWWHRILNLVLQVLMFQPGASPAEIHSYCANGAAELFEVELVLTWLVSTNAARRHENNTYEVKGGFWAAFGEELVGEEDDWFGEHVKRTKVQETHKPWRFQYNLRSARVSAMLGGATSNERDEDLDRDENNGDGIDSDSNRSPSRTSAVTDAEVAEGPLESVMASETPPQVTQQQDEDVAMVDAEQEAEDAIVDAVMADSARSQDPDAEGEPDDDI